MRAKVAALAVAVVVGSALTATTSSRLVAQTSAGGVQRAELRMSAQLVVGYRMHVRQAAPARIVDRSAGMVEVELSLEAASNVAWRLTLVAPLSQDSAATRRTEVRDASGVWRPLDPSSGAVLVVAEWPPCNPTPLTVRIRVYDGATLATLTVPRLMMDVATGGL